MLMLFIYLALAIGVSFFCSLAEATLLSVRPSYVAALQRRGARGAGALERLRENLDRPLAAILTLNTVAHTGGAAGVGAEAAVVFGNQYLGITSGVLTLLILVFSEIIPKSLGASHWKRLAPTMGVLIEWLTRLLAPFVWLSARITRLTAGSATSAYTFTRDEMAAMAEIGAREGVLPAHELEAVQNLMRLHQIPLRDIMTPRTVIFSLPAAMTVADFFNEHADQPFSRVPVFGDHPDDFTGYVLKGELFAAQARGEADAPLSDFARKVLALPDNQVASDALEGMTRERSHFALVVDEYGTVQGLITLEDVLETVIGLEITDELDTVEDMQDLARQRWRRRMIRLGIDPDSLER